jgi:hypothetical protein
MFKIMGVRKMVNTRQQRAKLPPVVDDAANRNAAKANAIIATLTSNQARARALSDGALICERNLQCRVDRFGSRIGKENAVQPLRHDRRQSRRQFKRKRVTQLEWRGIVQLGGAFLDGLDNRRAAMACVYRP